MSFIFDLFKGKQYLIIGIASILLGLYITMLQVRISLLKSDIVELKAEKKNLIQITHDWQRVYIQLKAKTEQCNAAVNSYQQAVVQAKRLSDQALKAAESKLASAKRVTKSAEARISLPAEPSRSCSQAVIDAKNDIRGLL